MKTKPLLDMIQHPWEILLGDDVQRDEMGTFRKHEELDVQLEQMLLSRNRKGCSIGILSLKNPGQTLKLNDMLHEFN